MSKSGSIRYASSPRCYWIIRSSSALKIWLPAVSLRKTNSRPPPPDVLGKSNPAHSYAGTSRSLLGRRRSSLPSRTTPTSSLKAQGLPTGDRRGGQYLVCLWVWWYCWSDRRWWGREIVLRACRVSFPRRVRPRACSWSNRQRTSIVWYCTDFCLY